MVLREEDLGHYEEFRRFFVSTFELDGLSADGGEVSWVTIEGGETYEIVFLGRSGTPFPSGVEIRILTPRFEPLDDERIDHDLWVFLKWMVSNVEGDWSVADLERTGRLYRIPWAEEPPNDD